MEGTGSLCSDSMKSWSEIFSALCLLIDKPIHMQATDYVTITNSNLIISHIILLY